MFSGCATLHNVKETELRKSNQEFFPSAGGFSRSRYKYWGHFSAMSRIDVCPYSYLHWRGYFGGYWVLFIKTGEFSVRVTKIVPRIGAS